MKRKCEVRERVPCKHSFPGSIFWWRCTIFLAIAIAVANSNFSFHAPLFAQDVKADVGNPRTEESDATLEAIENDILANKLQDVEPRLQGYLQAHPESAKAHYDLGYLQFRNHDVRSSIRELSKSLELNSANAEAHKVLGLDCASVGRYDLAEVELQVAAQLTPESGEIHYFLARTYYTLGVYPLAKTEFETAIRLEPASVKAYSNLGLTLEALGDNDGALKNYTQAIRLQRVDPMTAKYEWPYTYLSAFYNRQHQASEALVYAQNAIEINPQSDAAYFEMTKAYRTMSDLQKAAAAAREAIAISPQAQYYYVLSQVLREAGDQKQSAQALEKYAELQKHVDAAHPVRSRQEPVIAVEPQ
jgi:tetratricopeptide (TPR) repeat protein